MQLFHVVHVMQQDRNIHIVSFDIKHRVLKERKNDIKDILKEGKMWIFSQQFISQTYGIRSELLRIDIQ